MAERVNDRSVTSRRGTGEGGAPRRGLSVTADGAPIFPGNLKLTNETAGTGGIRTIQGGSGGQASNGTIAVQITGELKKPIPRADAPNYNEKPPTIKSLGPEVNGPANGGLSSAGYEKAHLWGPGFGDEARDGIMLAPQEVNQVFQNQKMEDALRELQKRAGEDGKVLVTATATSHPTRTTVPVDQPILANVTYTFSLQSGNDPPRELATVDISVDKPPVTNPDVQVQISARPANPGSDDAAVLLDALKADDKPKPGASS